jgi:hypothetical protein
LFDSFELNGSTAASPKVLRPLPITDPPGAGLAGFSPGSSPLASIAIWSSKMAELEAMCVPCVGHGRTVALGLEKCRARGTLQSDGKYLSSKTVARRFLVALFGLVTLVSGCGRAAAPAPMVPERTADHAPHRGEHRRPHLIAPPPAYGNKVVMAKSGDRAALN